MASGLTPPCGEFCHPGGKDNNRTTLGGYSMNRLQGKVAVVTGAGAIREGLGNGRATAILFAREGAKVFLVDINREFAEET